MIRHYLASAFVAIARTPFTAAARILTLALGLFAMIAVMGIVSYWRSSDSQITPPDGRVLVFTRSATWQDEEGGVGRPSPATQTFLAKYLREDLPEFEAIARLRRLGEIPVKADNRTVILSGANADANIFDIFKFNFIAGDPKTALQGGNGIVLSQEAAERLFGTTQALGRSLSLNGEREAVVTGVIGPIPEPSHFVIPEFGGAIDYLSALPPDATGEERWTSFSMLTYGLLPASGAPSREAINHRLADLVERRMPPEARQRYDLILGVEQVDRFTEMRLDSLLFGPRENALSVVNVFFGLGIIVLGVACLNYANLAAAQTLSSIGVIGMRRVLGAGRAGILLQGWIEAAVMTLAALATAAALLWLAAPALSAQAGIDLIGSLMRDPMALAAIAGLACAVTLLAAIYPALIVSRVRPADAVRTGRVRASPHGLAALLVGLQFASASVLLIAVIVVGQQNAHVRSVALDRGVDPVVVLPRVMSSGVAVTTLRQQLAAQPQIKAVGEVRFAPWDGSASSTYVSLFPLGARGPNVGVLPVGFGYFDVYGQTLLAGRAFDEERDQSDRRLLPDGGKRVAPDRVVIDRVYAEQLGFASPQGAIGQLLYYSRADMPDVTGARYEIMGVVETRPYLIQTGTEGGTIYDLSANAPQNTPLIRIAADDIDGGLAAIAKAWKALATEGAPGYRFEDELFEQSFQAYERVGQLFLALSVLAFLISSTGLLGMALHVVQRRMHEIGVRKILGSSSQGVIRLLLADFSKPILIANLVAWPLAYFAAQAYLSVFAYRIDLTPAPFLLSMLITLSIAWAAIIGVVLKAASIRPAEVLRHA